jgi:hypothetical protein
MRKAWAGCASPAPASHLLGADGNGWKLRLMAAEVPMPWDWPVEVNCLEARAFCRWKARDRPAGAPADRG